MNLHWDIGDVVDTESVESDIFFTACNLCVPHSCKNMLKLRSIFI
jgi:hypothetical protein